MKDEPFMRIFAVVSVVLCGIAGVGCLLTAFLLFAVLGDEPLRVVGPHSAGTLLIANNLRLFVLCWLLYFWAGFAASFGLLRGRQWARFLWMVLLGLLICWLLFVTVAELFFPGPPELSGSGQQLPSFASLAPFVVLPVVFGLSSLAAWLIWRLWRFGQVRDK